MLLSRAVTLQSWFERGRKGPWKDAGWLPLSFHPPTLQLLQTLSKTAAPGKAKTFGLVLGLIAFLVIWFAPIPGLSKPGTHALAVAVLTAIWWILAVMPPAFPAVLACSLFFVLRVAKPVDAFSGFVSPSIWMLFFALVMAKGVERSGLGKRIASWLMSKTALSFNGIVLVFIGLCIIFPFFLPSTVASVSLTMALAIGIMDALGIERGPNSKISCGLTCFVAVLTLTMGRAPLTGSLPNFIATGLVHDIAGVDISWISWLKSMWVHDPDPRHCHLLLRDASLPAGQGHLGHGYEAPSGGDAGGFGAVDGGRDSLRDSGGGGNSAVGI